MRSSEMLTAVVGLEDVIVVTTPDAVLVLNSKEADKVKALVDDLKRRNRREVIEHRRVYRPWGYYQSVDQGTPLSGQAHPGAPWGQPVLAEALPSR